MHPTCTTLTAGTASFQQLLEPSVNLIRGSFTISRNSPLMRKSILGIIPSTKRPRMRVKVLRGHICNINRIRRRLKRVYDRRRRASLKSSCFLSMNSRMRDSISTNLEMRGELNSAILHGRPQVVPEYFEGRRVMTATQDCRVSQSGSAGREG